ncbi:hypothetical protein [Bifidobacterium olomucense]|uniref:Histidine kinase n=1 Tax=Bifidobacterium olomucense TaxID=2675324 RepID=A0A7Y0EWB3_9BIFI|nr:hypothetical protein [Bifidobacterium sp. DSM 109959]NMM97613.1 hypothetical protein [Bifidobacterium sp. DSM 109959]
MNDTSAGNETGEKPESKSLRGLRESASSDVGSRCNAGLRHVVHWGREHWFRIVIATFVLAITLTEWTVIPPVHPPNYFFSLMSVVAIILSPFIPRISGWLIIVTVIARLLVPDLSGPNPLWAAYLALAIIGYDSAIPVAMAALLTVTLAECVPVALNRFNALSATWIGMVNYSGMFTLATMAGMSFRWRKQRDEIREQAMALERRQWQLDTLQRNTRLASRIHDSASGGLSYIALTAQRELRRIGDDPSRLAERQDWRFINDQALSVLDEIHHVIDLLEQPQSSGRSSSDGPDESDAMDSTMNPVVSSASKALPTFPVSSGAASNRWAKLQSAVRQARARLMHLGFTGTIEMRGSLSDECSDESVAEAANLLSELAANITRHMNPDDGKYYCVITLSNTVLEIMETNPITVRGSIGRAHNDKTTDMLKPHGSGIAMHRRMIRSLGGELNITTEDDDWILYARIPCIPGIRR